MRSKYKIKDFKFGKVITSDHCMLLHDSGLIDALLLENLKNKSIRKAIMLKRDDKKYDRMVHHWDIFSICNIRDATDSELVLAIAKLKDEELREKLKVFYKTRR